MTFQIDWPNAQPLRGAVKVCPHCGSTHNPLQLVVATTIERLPNAQLQGHKNTMIFACSSCSLPYIDFPAREKTFPSIRLGANIRHLPPDMARLYEEARDASSVGAHTACAMLARKVLMNLAVHEGAKENGSFAYYVDYLVDNGFVPPKGRPWVDKIRTTGNAATHEIELVSQDGASDVMYLLENLLRFNFEMVGPSI